MESESWRRKRELFERALELDAAERPRFLHRACGGDEALAAEVGRLLAADARGGRFLAEPLLSPRREESDSPRPFSAGDQIGSYRIVEEIGEGGMSTVFLAERVDRAFERRVVIKVVRSDRAGRASEHRLARERQILAELDHPRIARLYDGGDTEDGRAYFVMELVEGEPLDAFCESRGLDVRARVELVHKVCSAVHFAHQKLVVHCDLKPSNILVAAEGEPRLLDFGIARLLAAADGREAGGDPGLQARHLTPGYASPEQARGDPLSTASDVYSLGVVLHRLLTGRLPPRPGSLVDEAEPLGGDLGRIVRKAIDAEPSRRYGSAEQLAEDLRRYLEGLPVIAGPGTAAYRLRKFLGRNRLAVAAAGLITALALGLAASLWLHARRIARERDDLEAVGGLVENVFRIAEERETLSVREVIDRGSAMLALQLGEQPSLRARLQHTMGKIYLNLQEPEPAMRQLEEAFELRRELLGGDAPATIETRSSLGVALAFFGTYETDREKGREAMARGESEARLALRAARRELRPEDPELVELLNNLVQVLCLREDWEAADAPSAEALERAERDLAEADLELAVALAQRAVVHAERGERVRAAGLYRRAVALHRRHRGATYPAVGTLLNNLAVTLKEQGDLATAKEAYSQALEVLRHFGEGPTLARTLFNLGRLEAESGELAAAEPLLREALSIFEASSGREHFYAMAIAVHLAAVLGRTGEQLAVEALLAERLPLWREAHPESWLPARAEGLLGESLLVRERPAEAAPLLERSYRRLREARGEEDRFTREALRRLRHLYEAWGEPEKLAELDSESGAFALP